MAVRSGGAKRFRPVPNGAGFRVGRGSMAGKKQVAGYGARHQKPIPKRNPPGPTPNADHQPLDAAAPRTVRLGGPGKRETRGNRDR